MIVISTYDKNLLNAGPKAKMDIENVLSEKYNAKIISLYFKTNGSIIDKIKDRLNKLVTCKKIEKADDLVVVQYPFDGNIPYTKNIKNKIGIIHDIQGLRYQKPNEKEIESINTCKYIISHNQKMTDYLVAKGIDKSKIINLELFDYISNDTIETKYEFDKNDVKVVYPGNLSIEKSPFLYQLSEKEMKYKLLVYGVGINELNNDKIIYCGKFAPNQVNTIKGDIGLIWDGNKDETDEKENFKNYTKYNNPHKLSCCLARGLPVIVWKKSAIASFVEKNKIGYTISKLADINKIDFSEYHKYRENAIKIGKQIRKGNYIITAFDKILNGGNKR